VPTVRTISLSDAGASVLITRPEPGASETAERVAALGFLPVVAPLLEINTLSVAWPPSGEVQAILVTSGNAIPALPASHRHLPLLAVGQATAQNARQAGFKEVQSADGDAAALADLAGRVCRPHGGPLLLATGRRQGHALATDLRRRGFAVVRRVVYAAEPVPLLPDTARSALSAGTLRAALFFSAETAQAGVRLIEAAGLSDAVRAVDAVAIGQPAAVALEALPWRRVRVAARPDQDAMLALLQ
jgi:uroporphyrinogen-III synthase